MATSQFGGIPLDSSVPASSFGGVPVDSAATPTSRFGGLPLSAQSTQDQPGIVSRFFSGVGDTLSKTAQKLNIENTLDAIENIGDRMRAGDWGAIKDAVDFLPQMRVGDQRGPLPQQTADLQDTYQKIKTGDYSGAAADVLPYVLVNAGPSAVDATSNAVSAGINASKPIVQGVKAATPAIIRNLPVVGKPVAAGWDAFQAGRQAFQDARAQQQSDAAVQAQRANPTQPLWQQAGTQPTNPEPPKGPELSDADLADIRAQWQQKMQARKSAVTSSDPQQQTPQPPVSLLDDIARAQAGKAYAKLTPGQQAKAQSIAQRMLSRSTPAAEAPSQPTPTPEATAPSPAAPAPPQKPGSGVSAPSAVPPASGGATYSQPNASGSSTPDSRGTTLDGMLAQVQYYPPGAAKDIPTPAQLGYGVYGEMLPDDSSTLRHIQAENEKAYNAADYAFRNGITDPRIFDLLDSTQRKQFMQEALDHGRMVGNPTPQTAYRTGLDGHTLRLAKAHLTKMVSDADNDPNGAQPQAISPGLGPVLAAPTVRALTSAADAGILDSLSSGQKATLQTLVRTGDNDSIQRMLKDMSAAYGSSAQTASSSK